MTQTFAGPEAYRIRPPGAQRPVRIRRIVPGNSPEERLLFLLAAICLISGEAALIGADQKLQLAEDGLVFPKNMLAKLKMRRRRSWSDLSAIVMRSGEGKIIEFRFRSGGSALIDTSKFPTTQLEQFFLLLDQLAPHCARSPEVVAFRHALLNKANVSEQGRSYTEMWETELAEHYACTNFRTPDLADFALRG